MKRLLTALLLALTAALCLSLFAACSAKQHVHSWGKWEYTQNHKHQRICNDENCNEKETGSCDFEVSVTQPDCKNAGFTTYTCKLCGFSYTEGGADANGHSFTEWKYAGTDENGRRIHTAVCDSGCGAVATEPCEHDSVVTEPDCENGGYTSHTCKLCGDEFRDAETLPLNHDWGEWEQGGKDADGDYIHKSVCRHNTEHVKTEKCQLTQTTVDATCEKGGYTEHSCPNCGQSFQDNFTEKLNHNWGDWKYAGKDQDGNDTHTRKCLRADCDEEQNAKCNIVSVEDAATCTKPEKITKTCEDCRHSTTEDGDDLALGHTWSTRTHSEKDGKHIHSRYCLVCEEPDEDAECDFDIVTTDPTCYSKGYSTYTCGGCGYSYTDNETDTLEHSWSGWAYNEENSAHYRRCENDGCAEVQWGQCDYDEFITHPTCEAQGYTTYRCKTCPHEYQDDFVKATDHEWGKWTHDEGTNTHSRHCLNDPNHVQNGESCVFSTETIDPTCEIAGILRHTCQYCDNSYDEEGEPATGHSYGKWEYAGIDENGKDYHNKVCAVCDNELREECKIVSSSQAPTCSTPEIEREICSECLHTDEGIGDLPALGHKYGEWQQGTKADGTHYHYHVCENNSEHREEADCSFGVHTTDPTCTEQGVRKYTCTECGFNYSENFGSAKGHTWGGWLIDSDRETHSHNCTVCGETASETCEFRQLSVTAPTCDDKGYTTYICDICKDTYDENYIDAKGHAWEKPSYAEIIDGKHNHVYVCRHDNSHKKYEECTDSDPVVTKPTCQLAGYTTYNCEKCGATYTDNPTPANGQHNWGKWTAIYNPFDQSASFYCHTHSCQNPGCTAKETFNCNLEKVSKEATCEEAGYSYLECEECNRKAQRIDIDKLGHDFGGYTHIEEDGVDKHVRTCRRKDCNVQEKEECEFVSTEKVPTCTYNGSKTDYCEKCHYSETVELEQLEHKWGKWQLEKEGTHYRTCTACKTTEKDECHYDVEVHEATCTEKGYTKSVCRECSNIKITYSDGGYGHKWTEIKITDENHSAKCSECGLTVNDAHDYSLSNLCSVCKHDGLVYIADSTNTYCIVWHDRNVRQAKKIEIPEIHDGKPVREISTKIYNSQLGGFVSNKYVEEVILPENLETIGSSAFLNCTNLKKVTVRNEEENDYTPSLKTIGDYAFRGCTRLQSAQNLPATLQTIGEYAFFDCNALSDIKLSEGLEFIGARAFDGTAYYKNAANWTGGNALYIGKHLIKVKSEASDVFTVLDGTLTIGVEAFKDCKSVTKVVLPKELIHIDADAFLNCTALKDVEFKGDFGGWTKIHFVNDYSSPLAYADKLHIDQAHDEITIPDGVTAIPANTFRNTGIKTIHIPASVTKIGDNAFADCAQLATVTVAEGSKLAEIGRDAFKGSLYYNTDANWDDGVLYLKDESKEHCFAVVGGEKAKGAVNIKEGTLVIADYTFYNLEGITSVVTPDSIREIGKYAFNGCSGITEATIGSECKKIAEHAFTGCTQLNSVTFNNTAHWLYRRVGQPIYRGVDAGLLSDKSRAADYIKDANLFELSKL